MKSVKNKVVDVKVKTTNAPSHSKGKTESKVRQSRFQNVVHSNEANSLELKRRQRVIDVRNQEKVIH